MAAERLGDGQTKGPAILTLKTIPPLLELGERTLEYYVHETNLLFIQECFAHPQMLAQIRKPW